MVNIYGTPEIFINEYRAMLAERLLILTNYDVDKEVKKKIPKNFLYFFLTGAIFGIVEIKIGRKFLSNF